MLSRLLGLFTPRPGIASPGVLLGRATLEAEAVGCSPSPAKYGAYLCPKVCYVVGRE